MYGITDAIIFEIAKNYTIIKNTKKELANYSL